MRGVEEYFDILKYVKFTRLSNMAKMVGDTTAVKEFERNKDETLFGINPFSRNYTSVYRALPGRERDYFDSFEHAETVEEKQRILEMVPENEKSLYIARWKLVHADEVKKAMKSGKLTEEQMGQAEEEIRGIYDEASSEGFPKTKDLLAEYLKTKLKGENYGDWYRRTKLLPEVGFIPGADFVGFHPSVNLEDVKLKVVREMGEDPIKYNLWPSRDRQMPYNPEDTEGAAREIMKGERLSPEDMKSRLSDLLFADKMKGDVFVTARADGKQETTLELDVKQDTDEEEVRQVRQVLNG
jgi:hypothetical protein